MGLCGYWWFVFNNHRLYLPRMIRLAGRGPDLPEVFWSVFGFTVTMVSIVPSIPVVSIRS